MSIAIPLKQTDGSPAATANSLGVGSVTLLSGTRYLVLLAGADQTVLGAHIQWDASILFTSITVEDCSIPIEAFASDANKGLLVTTSGVWIPEKPTTAYVATAPDPSATLTVTNGVIALTSGQAGGAHFHIVDTGAERTRLNILVGATGGVVRIATHVKKK